MLASKSKATTRDRQHDVLNASPLDWAQANFLFEENNLDGMLTVLDIMVSLYLFCTSFSLTFSCSPFFNPCVGDDGNIFHKCVVFCCSLCLVCPYFHSFFSTGRGTGAYGPQILEGDVVGCRMFSILLSLDPLLILILLRLLTFSLLQFSTIQTTPFLSPRTAFGLVLLSRTWYVVSFRY
jgi:hypothetical protein